VSHNVKPWKDIASAARKRCTFCVLAVFQISPLCGRGCSAQQCLGGDNTRSMSVLLRWAGRALSVGGSGCWCYMEAGGVLSGALPRAANGDARVRIGVMSLAEEALAGYVLL
jgi:hypothetical protein